MSQISRRFCGVLRLLSRLQSNGVVEWWAPCELHSVATNARQRKGECATGRVETRGRLVQAVPGVGMLNKLIHHSNTPILQYSITPVLHHSNI